jgi:hypothetical protein
MKDAMEMENSESYRLAMDEKNGTWDLVPLHDG